MTPADARRLEAVLSIFKKLELTSRDGAFPSEDLLELSRLLNELRDHPRIEMSKLADLVRHLKPGMSLRTLVNLIVPVERALRKSVRDDDFLVSTEDRAREAAPALPLRLILQDIRSAFNVGSVLRSADGLGVERVHLCGYTQAPDEEKSARAALGAQNVVPWEKNLDPAELIRSLKNSGYRIVALETSERAQELAAPFERTPTAFVLGNERFGLDADLIAACDEIRRLPLQGRKNSLNVAVIAAVAAYEWKRQWTST